MQEFSNRNMEQGNFLFRTINFDEEKPEFHSLLQRYMFIFGTVLSSSKYDK
jgi:hypothetical protein